MRLRHTNQRQLILRAVKASAQPMTAEQVLRVVQGTNPDLGRSTTFRNLDFLSKRGEIIAIETADGVRRFLGHMFHEAVFRCQRCGKAKRLSSRTLNDYVQRKMFGPQTIMSSRLSASGLCTDCTKQLKRL